MSLGVIGGLGPMATAYFMELIIEMTQAERDQEHLKMIIYNCPEIPDRTAYILGKSSDNPVVPIIKIGNELKKQGVSCIAIPCITAHYFHDEIEQKIECKVLNAIYETAHLLKLAGICNVGIMATDGTIQSLIFQNEIESSGMKAVIPDEQHQQIVMKMIYEDIKAGKKPDIDKFNNVVEHLKSNGAQVVILGCTELSLVKKQYHFTNGIIDAMEVLARTAILECGKKVKPEFENLFVPFE